MSGGQLYVVHIAGLILILILILGFEQAVGACLQTRTTTTWPSQSFLDASCTLCCCYWLFFTAGSAGQGGVRRQRRAL
jgi:hypothetical protein